MWNKQQILGFRIRLLLHILWFLNYSCWYQILNLSNFRIKGIAKSSLFLIAIANYIDLFLHDVSVTAKSLYGI